MRKRISILLIGFTAMFASGCLLADMAGRLANIPDHCDLVNVEDGSWLSVSFGCAFDNPFEALPG